MEILRPLQYIFHLSINTIWEFYFRRFDVTAEQVNVNWNGTVRDDSARIHGFAFRETGYLGQYELVNRFAEYQALTYCKEHVLASMEGKGRLGNFSLVGVGHDEYDTHRFVITKNKIHESFVVSIRGTTSNIHEVWNDFDARVTTLPCQYFPKSCQDGNVKVHEGFLHQFEIVAEQVTGLVELLAAEHPKYSVILTAHSLGSAVGTLMTRHWIETTKVHLAAAYLYGLPIVGNSHFAATTNDSRIFQIVNENDIVPSIGFVRGEPIHASALWMQNNGTLATNVSGYNVMPFANKSWYRHSHLAGIEINENYCKLNETLKSPSPSPSPNEGSTSTSSSFHLWITLVSVLVLLLVGILVTIWKKKRLRRRILQPQLKIMN